ncbi:MAG: hypothetical protein GKR89_17130 [Candidatus Latescibacteria bacterium]|nr:hypothetical protein [Candidatus Latescibacterota bacterium]
MRSKGRSHRTAEFFSHLFNPSGVALGVFGLLAWQGYSTWLPALVGMVCFAFFPGLILVSMLKKGRIDQLYPSQRQQRSGLLLLGAGCYFLGSGALWLVGAKIFIVAAGLVFATSALLVWWVNRYWKISIHSVGVSGGVAVLLIMMGIEAWIWTLTLPLIAWARWHLRAHSPAQIAAGFLLGGGAAWGLYHFVGAP